MEENVQRLSSQRAAAMDLSAAAGAARGKQVGQQEPLTVRHVLCTGKTMSVDISCARYWTWTARVPAESLLPAMTLSYLNTRCKVAGCPVSKLGTGHLVCA